jgi:hypothetical protein
MHVSSIIHKFAIIAAAIIGTTTISRAASTSSGLLFYAPFQNGPIPAVTNGSAKLLFNENVQTDSGKSGDAAKVLSRQSQLVFDGPGNAYTQAGTASFYWRLDEDTAGKSVSILNLSTIEKTDNQRYIELSYVAGKFRMYLSAGNLGGQTLTSAPILVFPGEWHQLTLCWDQTYGAALLVDGEIAFQFNKTWSYDGVIGSIGLGVSQSPGHSPVTVFSQSFDELRIYDRWLDDPNLQKLIHGQAADASQLDVSSLTNRRLAFYQWNRDSAARLPQLKIALSGGMALRQASIDNTQATGRELFDGERAVFWPADKSTFNQTLQITMAENQPFDLVQMLGVGHLMLMRKEDQRKLLDFQSDTEALQSFTVPTMPNTRQLILQTMAPTGKDLFTSCAASEIQLFQQAFYPYEFDHSWQKVLLRSAADADQSLDEMLHIRQAFYSSDQQTLIAQDGAASGQVTIPAMHTFHIIGPAQAQDEELDAVAIELKLVNRIPAFARVEISDPQNPLHFLTAVDVHLNEGAGAMRLMLDHRDVPLPQGARPIISLTFSEDATLDLAGSSVRYQWKK